ncbi:hypothetical protein Q1695_003555 [Nippostrongylus brasiliensis]|nr:hypothetical protein Q1695_003555 [Nippostrongylus brasiliensis]
MEEQISQLSLSTNSDAKSLSVTTRAIGLPCAFSYCFFKGVEQRLTATVCTVNTIYRVNLALFQIELPLCINEEHGFDTCWPSPETNRSDAFPSVLTLQLYPTYLHIMSIGRF